MPNTLTVELPFGLDPEEARLLLTMKLFEEGKISLGHAANMAGYTKRTYMELLGKKGIPVYNYDADDLERELESLKTFREELTRETTPAPESPIPGQ
jgi:predicted HTH domain antitoxin